MNIPDLPPAKHFKVDLFPATVSGPSLPPGIPLETRLLVTDSHVLVFHLSNIGDVVLLYSAPLHEVVRATDVGVRGVRITTQDGDVIEAKKCLECCGCGIKQLKAARVYDPPLPLEPLPF